MFNEYDRVETLVEKDGFPAGTKGVIVSLYSTGPACEVEIWDENSSPVDVVTLPIPKESLIEINKVVPLYAAQRFYNIAAHKYKTLDMKIVYNTVKFDIIDLKNNIENILDKETRC